MSDPWEFKIGTDVTCKDGECGILRRVVVDPIARSVTHLVVGPRHRRTKDRLVPIDLVEASAPRIRLRCTIADFALLEAAEETTTLLPGATEPWETGFEGPLADAAEEELSLSYYELRTGGMGRGIGGVSRGSTGTPPRTVRYDRVPAGEVQVRRAEHVYASDGPVGRVHGLVIDPKDHHVTHVLLAEGHLFGERQVTIPISAVKGDEGDHLRLTLTKDQVRDLPSIEIGLAGTADED